jgi:hypothetical protein
MVTSKCPFDTVEAWNEYQRGQLTLSTIRTTSGNALRKDPTLARKFRVWGIDLPRHNKTQNGNAPRIRARLRSPWIYLKLSKENTTDYKMIFDDLNVIYFE